MEAMTIEENLTIDAPVHSIWKTLTDPELTKSYMYNCKALSSWKVGEPLIWKGAEDQVIYVKGHITSYIENQELGFTVFDPNQSFDDIPRNYLQTVYTLHKTDESVQLEVKQFGFEEADNGQERYQHTKDQGGWSMVLQGIKKLAEGMEN